MRKYKKSKRKGFGLEEYIASLLKPVDEFAKPTKNSGASGSIGDVQNKYFYIECKEKHTKLNVIMDYVNEYIKLCKQIPIGSIKIPLIAIENENKEKFVVIHVKDFFEIVKEAYKGKE